MVTETLKNRVFFVSAKTEILGDVRDKGKYFAIEF